MNKNKTTWLTPLKAKLVKLKGHFSATHDILRVIALRHLSDTLFNLSESLLQKEEIEALRQQNHSMKPPRLYEVWSRYNKPAMLFLILPSGRSKATPEYIAEALNQ